MNLSISDCLTMIKSSLQHAVGIALTVLAGHACAGERVRILSPWGTVNAVLADNPSAHALLRRLPIELPMRDHLRQEKTGKLSSPLPEHTRTVQFINGDLGLWGQSDFVIYYANGTVPSPGIILLGRIEGEAQLFNRPGTTTVRIERAE